MGIFKRIGSLVKSNANELVDKAEDTEKMLNQAIVEMANQLGNAKKQVSEAIADERRVNKQWEQELEKSKGWKEKATMAVRAGEDGLAKEALLRKREHADLAEQYQKQWEGQKTAVEQLKGSLRALNGKFEAAKRKQKLLVAKKKRADAQKSIQETLSGTEKDGAFDTFERMEHQIEQAEAEAESAAEINEENSGDELGQRFKELEAASGEDMELLALKDELGLLEAKTEEDEVAGALEAGRLDEAGESAEAESAAVVVQREESVEGSRNRSS